MLHVLCCHRRRQGNENAPSCEAKSQRPGQGKCKKKGKKRNKHTPESEEVLPQSSYKKDALQLCVPGTLLVSASSSRSQTTHVCVSSGRTLPGFKYNFPDTQAESWSPRVLETRSPVVQVASARQKRCARPPQKQTHTGGHTEGPAG